jgi:hypothetical protein
MRRLPLAVCERIMDQARALGIDEVLMEDLLERVERDPGVPELMPRSPEVTAATQQALRNLGVPEHLIEDFVAQVGGVQPGHLTLAQIELEQEQRLLEHRRQSQRTRTQKSRLLARFNPQAEDLEEEAAFQLWREEQRTQREVGLTDAQLAERDERRRALTRERVARHRYLRSASRLALPPAYNAPEGGVGAVANDQAHPDEARRGASDAGPQTRQPTPGEGGV